MEPTCGFFSDSGNESPESIDSDSAEGAERVRGDKKKKKNPGRGEQNDAALVPSALNSQAPGAAKTGATVKHQPSELQHKHLQLQGSQQRPSPPLHPPPASQITSALTGGPYLLFLRLRLLLLRGVGRPSPQHLVPHSAVSQIRPGPEKRLRRAQVSSGVVFTLVKNA